MTASHTPGPWSVGVKTGTLVFAGRDGGMGDFICEVSGEDSTPRTVNKANARLIAAAPELLEAAEAAMNCIGELPPSQARIEVAQLLTAAIAKAKGEQP